MLPCAWVCRRADDETKERAQKAREELAGKQQAVAANKALAATLGGGDAKWAKWGSGNTTKVASSSLKPETGNQGTPSVKEEKVADKQVPEENPGEGRAKMEVTISESTDVLVSPGDIVEAIRMRPEYSNGHLLYKLMNKSYGGD